MEQGDSRGGGINGVMWEALYNAVYLNGKITKSNGK